MQGLVGAPRSVLECVYIRPVLLFTGAQGLIVIINFDLNDIGISKNSKNNNNDNDRNSAARKSSNNRITNATNTKTKNLNNSNIN